MRGWAPEGPSFHRLLNQNQEVPPEEVRLRGYTRDILERDGEPVGVAYAAFADYVGELPLVAWDLRYNLDEVLLPEWKRLGIDPIGTRGFYALRLARRLLDPVPAGDCKLQTLGEYYRLPQRGTPEAPGNLETVVDLIGQVLGPIAEKRGLDSWQSVCDFITREWYPARLGFGKFKGRLFRDALTDDALRDWLMALSRSPNQRNAAVGAWYLDRLVEASRREAALPPPQVAAQGVDDLGAPETGIVIYTDPAIKELKHLIQTARARLAEVEAQFMNDSSHVEFIQWRLYVLLRDRYRHRDRLERLVEYRRRYVDTLLEDGDEEAEYVARSHERSQADLDEDYESLDRDADHRIEPTTDQEQDVKALWRKLVKMYHPDRHPEAPEKQERYNLLMQAINQAKDRGDLGTLHEIANDPQGFCRRRGWGHIDVEDHDDVDRLTRLHEGLEAQIIALIENLNALHESPAFKMWQRVEAMPELLDEIAAEQAADLDAEIAALEAESAQLGAGIEELTGESCRVGL